jgi:hypothetical protein
MAMVGAQHEGLGAADSLPSRLPHRTPRSEGAPWSGGGSSAPASPAIADSWAVRTACEPDIFRVVVVIAAARQGRGDARGQRSAGAVTTAGESRRGAALGGSAAGGGADAAATAAKALSSRKDPAAAVAKR